MRWHITQPIADHPCVEPVLYRDQLPRRLLAVSGSTAHGQADTAVVRWKSSRVDNLHAVFPSCLTGRLRIRRWVQSNQTSSPAGRRALGPLIRRLSRLAVVAFLTNGKRKKT